MAVQCPNKSHPDWKQLVEDTGSESKAYLAYYQNGMEIPLKNQSIKSYINEASQQQIQDRLTPFFNKIGVSLKEVSSINDTNGNPIGAIAASNVLHKSLEIVKGEATIDTVPEEAAHFFVQILKNNKSPLYDSMASEIEGYDVFKDVALQYGDIYKNNAEKLKDEAIGKLIGQQIVDKFNQPEKIDRANRWWNKVLNYLKEKLGVIDKQSLEDAIISNNPFSKAADTILGKYGYGSLHLDEDASPEANETFYQLRNSKELEDRIRGKFNLLEGKNRSFTITEGDKTRPVANTVSDKINKDIEKRYTDTRSEAEIKKQDAFKQIAGKAHSDFSNIIERTVAARDNKTAPAKVVSTNEAVYKTLEPYVQQLIDSLPADSRIITDAPLYDKKSDTATKADLIVIHADNKIDVLDWKFIDYGKNKKANSFKEGLYNDKLTAIRNILRDNYGVNNFGKLRSIPIDARFSDNSFESIKVGSQDLANVTKEDSYLLPIPINEEMTGDEKLDRLIQGLLKRKEDLQKSRAPIDATRQQQNLFNEKKYADVKATGDAIRAIQLKHDLKQYVNIGLNTVKDLSTTPINQYSREQLIDLQNQMAFYGKDMLGLVKDKVKDFTDVEKTELNRLVTESQIYFEDIKSELGARLLATGSEGLDQPFKEGSYLSRTLRTISQQDHPIIKEFWSKLVLPAKAKTRASVDELNEKIKSSIVEVQKLFPSKRGGDLFDWMIDKGKNGELKIAAKYRSDFYDKLTKARNDIKEGKLKDDNIAFIKKHGTFDKEAYTRDFNDKIEALNYIYRNDTDKDEKISNRIKSFRNKNDDEFGLTNPSNPYFKLNEDANLYSDKYRKIASTPELKQFYDLWMEHSKEFQNYIGQRQLGGKFMWNIRNDLIDSFHENGWGAFTSMSSILDHLEARSSDNLGMVDPNTGLPTYEIPAYYTQASLKYNEAKQEWVHDSDNQSKDLGKVLSLVSAMAYNHKYMSEIEAPSKALGMMLANQETIQTDGNGNPVKNKLTGQIQKIIGSANTLEQFNDYMNYYIYGIKNKTKDLTFKIGNRNFSSLAVYNAATKWFVGKALIANPASIIAHAVRSDLNTRILGGMDRYYNGTEYNKSIKDIATRDDKSYKLMAYFDLMDGVNFKKKASELSTQFLGQYLTYDKMFIGHEMTDRFMRNAILLSTMKSHTYDEASGKILKMNSDREGVTLYDQLDVSGDKLDIKNVPQEALEAYRNKVLKLGDTALGNSSRDDMRIASLSVMTRALMTFRNWIPNMVYARYGDLRHDEDLDTYELGRYRTFWDNVVHKQFIPVILDGIRNFGIFGYGGKWGDATINRAKELYEQHMEKNPNSKITEQEFINLHLANTRGNMMELQIMAILLASMAAVTPDKDKHEKLEDGSARKWYAKSVERAIQDMSFFYSPSEFNKQLKSPVPVVNTYMSFYNFGKAYVDKGHDIITGSKAKGEKKNEFRKANFEMIPGLAGFESLLGYIDPDYNAVEGKKNEHTQQK